LKPGKINGDWKIRFTDHVREVFNERNPVPIHLFAGVFPQVLEEGFTSYEGFFFLNVPGHFGPEQFIQLKKVVSAGTAYTGFDEIGHALASIDFHLIGFDDFVEALLGLLKEGFMIGHAGCSFLGLA
jgi:hypothetical protein